MGNLEHTQYQPDFVTAPGESLSDALEAIGMTQAELATRIGKHRKTVNEIIKGNESISPKTAILLERALGVPATFWINRESKYRGYLAKLEEEKRLAKDVDWLRQFQINMMIKRAWLPKCDNKVDQLRELLNFFGVASRKQWNERWGQLEVSLRKSSAFSGDQMALRVWLRKGRIDAQQIDCKPFDRERFLSSLNQIRELTLEGTEVFEGTLKDICSNCGVAVVLVPEFPKMRVCGATRWLAPDKALIQLSLLFKRSDSLWFTFFHEAAHILLHPKRATFLEFQGKSSRSNMEDEADTFARRILIPDHRFNSFVCSELTKRNKFSYDAITLFARDMNISPDMVVGRLQFEGQLRYNDRTNLIRRLQWN